MRRLSYPGIKLPCVYVTNDDAEVVMLRESGMPFIRTSDSDDRVVLCVLYHWLRKRFPHINWRRQLGLGMAPRSYVVHVPGSTAAKESAEHTRHLVKEAEGRLDMPEEKTSERADDERDPGDAAMESSHDVADEAREFCDDGYHEEAREAVVRLEEFCADELSHVNVEQLQALGFLPAFMSDIADAIRTNLLTSMRWRDGWNKRLGCALGDFSVGTKAPNLIILDVSGSIPRGISATMLELIDSLRSQAEADLIVTGGSSYYWPASAELPTPGWIRANVDCGNEAVMFYRILRERLAGRHFGNVISFGDNDCPVDFAYWTNEKPDEDAAMGITVDRVMHFHTWSRNTRTGYAKWVRDANPNVEEVFDTSWCECMERH